jgi:hypothetical protein
MIYQGMKKEALGAAQLIGYGAALRVRRSSKCVGLACYTAGPSSNTGSALQGGPVLSGEKIRKQEWTLGKWMYE